MNRCRNGIKTIDLFATCGGACDGSMTRSRIGMNTIHSGRRRSAALAKVQGV
jgi:hypothetical protein